MRQSTGVGTNRGGTNAQHVGKRMQENTTYQHTPHKGERLNSHLRKQCVDRAGCPVCECPHDVHRCRLNNKRDKQHRRTGAWVVT
jgi:hypothetical protein